MIKLFNGIKNLVNRIVKIRKRYKLAVKVKNIILKILNLAATGYSLFTMLEPFLNKAKDTEVIDSK